MLSLNPRSLSQANSAKLLKWLEQPECKLLTECLEAELAGHSLAAIEMTMRKPLGFIQEKAPPEDALNSLAEAARIKVFLDKLKQLNGEYKFIEIAPTP